MESGTKEVNKDSLPRPESSSAGSVAAYPRERDSAISTKNRRLSGLAMASRLTA